ncbi:hypothetical protein CEE77_04565 [Lactobacillus crispatus]|nr:hypothetical protein CYJ78_00630 [Lactobacillus crispatus]TDM71300.1 hypothetical protein CEF00_05280 [Lactobacillus crispatus]TDM81181.1 hypothetical protein CEE96_04985 [Lactobacillus crispatus]TDM92519.1 hypothetical protein CEE91_04955 [Lactobacillus crispatus]TDM98887.1 hypothetical protein CEE88_04930 [Lactobacillus crispatus]
MSKIFGKIIHEGVLLSVCVFFVQTNHTRKELLFLMFKEINLRNHSSLHKLFYSLMEKHGKGKISRSSK